MFGHCFKNFINSVIHFLNFCFHLSFLIFISNTNQTCFLINDLIIFQYLRQNHFVIEYYVTKFEYEWEYIYIYVYSLSKLKAYNDLDNILHTNNVLHTTIYKSTYIYLYIIKCKHIILYIGILILSNVF